jgi:hypothetical protein
MGLDDHDDALQRRLEAAAQDVRKTYQPEISQCIQRCITYASGKTGSEVDGDTTQVPKPYENVIGPVPHFIRKADGLPAGSLVQVS